MIAPKRIENCFQTLLRFIKWCVRHFSSTNSHEYATPFGQKLISAADSFDIRFKTQPRFVMWFHAAHGGGFSGDFYHHQYFDLFAFLSNTPLPTHHHRPRHFHNGRPGHGGFRHRPSFRTGSNDLQVRHGFVQQVHHDIILVRKSFTLDAVKKDIYCGAKSSLQKLLILYRP